jgi:hypothetical protein
MPHSIVRLVVIDEATGCESVLANLESDHYDPDCFDALINTCLTNALKEIEGESLLALRPLRPEISVVLTTDTEEVVRPSFHLHPGTLQRLFEVGASFDFDPYT